MKQDNITQTIIIKRRNGKYSVKGDGDAYLFDLAYGAFRRGEMKRTWWQNVRRFFKILHKVLNECIEESIEIAFGTDTDDIAYSNPIFGLPEEHF